MSDFPLLEGKGVAKQILAQVSETRWAGLDLEGCWIDAASSDQSAPFLGF